MNINFTQIFQDSWNFIRNQRRFTLSFMLIFVAVLIIFQLILGYMQPIIFKEVSEQFAVMTQNIPAEAKAQLEAINGNDSTQSVLLSLAMITHPRMLAILISSQVINSFVITCGIIAVHQISRLQPFSLSMAFARGLQCFLGVLAINIIVLMPIGLGAAFAVGGNALGSLLMLVGIYIFIRLCLAYFVYLIENKSIFEAIRFTWQKTQKGFGSLFIFFLLAYVVLTMLHSQLSVLDDNIVLLFIGMVLSAFLHLFSIIFSYRFYTLFMK
ncbi:hypothetical protein EDC44_1079 [Cricetibacter osteomyelitidis]|uniref:Uncharacterized protein n=1 Tax=Cricetibacter osteomyelitidis TaxID=1521931 RepID=A0A4R2T0X2_9PAST|nr:hypothetical protein [Cricetibacter osteomyelitidis]TCP95730.1 hypothetical protein EDC44_1079 [Cricetibacter osteomyelitidis]